MWYLINATNTEQKYVLLADTEYVVGRRDCPILVSGDAAVSRKHAVIQLSHLDSNVSHAHKLPVIRLKDLSKFGTFVNKVQVRGETILKDGDVICFGSPKSTFRIINEPFIVTTSCLENVAKKKVKTVVRDLGGHVVNEWRKDCSLLVMNHISVTIKVICAMVSLKSVVTPKYLEDFLLFLKGEGSKPDAQQYLPPVAESQVNPENVSFSADERRQILFEGMTFIFLSQRQFKKMSLAIEMAGGIPRLMEEGSDDNSDDVLIENGTVVMNCDAEDQQLLTENGKKWLHHVQSFLKMKGKQMIHNSEIGYSVLYCSTERHCNPDVDTGQNLLPLPSQSLSESVQDFEVLVENTDLSSQTEQNKLLEKKKDKSSKMEVSMVSKVKDEPMDADKSECNLDRTSVQISEQGKPDITSLSKRVTMKQEKETPQKTSAVLGSKRGQRSSKSPSPVPQKRKQSLTLFDDSDEDERATSKMISSTATPAANHGGGTLFDDSDDEDRKISTSLKPAAAGSSLQPKRKRGQLDDDDDDDDKRFIQDKVNNKKKCFVRIEGEDVKEDTEQLTVKQEDENTVPGSPQLIQDSEIISHSLTSKKEIKQEVIELDEQEDKDKVRVYKTESVNQSCLPLNDEVPPGFLTTRKPIEYQVIKSEVYEKENDLPQNVVVTVFVDLVKRPIQKSNNTKTDENVPAGFVRWNGKLVRNFKKFKKVFHIGSDRLPNIIGGSDLVVHSSSQQKDLDDWFKDELQADSQKNERDRVVDDFFNSEPLPSHRKRSR